MHRQNMVTQKFVEVLGWDIGHTKLNVCSCYTSQLTLNNLGYI